ncbi:ATP-binding protein [Ferrimonas aestuarii]|uniref:histidine kinase n=1 Tax=Ferrimonas aestuarii TaxID=2569539 RepID=A0A4U1BMW7_9GAMM|nr:ATP-binding protein [Ferrimonas aestuarii]TKB55019.1 hypothetical protein FCL42_10680 [Ferrimonas aestuarii]
MRIPKFTLFTRLYLSILFVVCLTVLLTLYVVESLYRDGDFSLFVYEANYLHQQVSQAVHEGSQKDLDMLAYPLTLDFSFKVLSGDERYFPCQNCNYIKAIKGVDYYELEEGELMAVFISPSSDASLAIYQKLDEERTPEEHKFMSKFESQFELGVGVYPFLVVMAMVLIGITIMLVVRNLQDQIRSLIGYQRRFGDGELQVRADENMQKPLDELAHSFNLMATDVENLVRERDIFAQAIPHEVRTPLSRIQLATGLIQQRTEQPELKQLTADIDRYVDDVNELVNQVVEFSKLNASVDGGDETPPLSITLTPWLQTRLREMAMPEQRHIELQQSQKLMLSCSSVYLRLVFDNLIKNAVNHAASKVSVDTRCLGKRCVLVVEDDGSGIPEADRDTVFLPYARLDQSRNRRTGGLGLGLAIAKAAAARMDASIEVQESSLGGAKFVVSWPATRFALALSG